MTVSGNNFNGAGNVAIVFGSYGDATGVSCSMTSCSGYAPAGTAGQKVCVTVVTQYGGGSGGSCANFTYVAGPPSVSSLSPNWGYLVGGTTVNVNVNMNGASTVTSVLFNSSPISFTRSGSTVSITTPILPSGVSPNETPTNLTGGVCIQVSTGSYTSSCSKDSEFYYVVQSVSGVTPNAGPLSDGSAVVIAGNGFSSSVLTDPSCKAYFGSTEAGSCSVQSSGSISATPPDMTSTTSVPIQVSIEVDGQSYESGSSGAPTYTFIGAPIIDSMRPYSGAVSSSLVVNGANFDSGNAVVSSVQFCDGPGACTLASTFSVVSDSQLNVTVPAGLSAGTYAVVLASPGGVTSADR